MQFFFFGGGGGGVKEVYYGICASKELKLVSVPGRCSLRGHQQKVMYRLVPVREKWARAPHGAYCLFLSPDKSNLSWRLIKAMSRSS